MKRKQKRAESLFMEGRENFDRMCVKQLAKDQELSWFNLPLRSIFQQAVELATLCFCDQHKN